ncbi:hypothetical protein CB0940_05876 [Cercospora beticola]|uniref:F-box domain-containing protein n=1 Tax=Cercospora beticola TaxID=122368 RepID=A0A2G5I103_CERBT|nr:hypothetical protein CB0940_05876 [Cercospora beticola]PIA98203.1 hypothetical protein CB0940_05876 [Cercospora beticola]WPA98469.1 hypothetical protein RHO25_003081 [Cercospora beticola]CAK1359720.1 unnamed protein product [Cercospora beticola]
MEDIEPVDWTTLPTELFELVGTFLPTKDLRAVRLINRSANEKILRHYTKVNFSTISILLCYATSIREAAKIVAHPTFGTAIRQISLCVDTIILRNPYINPNSYLEIYAIGNYYDGHDNDAQIFNSSECIDEIADMNENGEDRQIFERVWQRLKEINKLETVHLTDSQLMVPGSEVEQRTPIAWQEFWGSGALSFPCIEAKKLPTLVTALDTLAEKDLMLDTFYMEPNRWAYLVDGPLTSSHTLDAKLFRQLKKLHLRVAPSRSGDSVRFGSMTGLGSSISAMRRLKQLTIECPGWCVMHNPRYTQEHLEDAIRGQVDHVSHVMFEHDFVLPGTVEHLYVKAHWVSLVDMGDLIRTNPQLKTLQVYAVVQEALGDEHSMDSGDVVAELRGSTGNSEVELDIHVPSKYRYEAER